jgi:ferredoxin
MSISPPAGRARVRINPLRCVRFGFCSEFCPEVFGLDDWGYAVIDGAEIAPDLVGLVRRAAELCPTEAISVELLDGSRPA